MAEVHLSERYVLSIVIAVVAAIFVFDILTPPDDVSIPFIYVIPIFLTLFLRWRLAYAIAGVATALSIIGAFIQPPRDSLDIVFMTNRAIAIAAQWITAFLVLSRKETEALMVAEFEAEKKKVELGRRFMDILSHEIGTSLTTIDGQAFRMRKLAEAGTSSDVAGRATKIRNAVRHVESVLKQVQLASEVGEGAIYFRPEPMSLAEVAKDVILDLPRAIEVDLDALPEQIHADPDMMRQVVANLLSNAIKFSSEGAPIQVRGVTEAGDAVLTFSDRGRGIAGDELIRLTEPYYRARNSQGVHGTGIGLYVAKRYVSAHGGTLDIVSDIGVGTTVTVRIPIQHAEQDAQP